MRVCPSALACNIFRDLAMVPLATTHSTTVASTAEVHAIPEVQMVTVPLAVKEAPQTTATPQLLSEKDLPQE